MDYLINVINFFFFTVIPNSIFLTYVDVYPDFYLPV